MKDEKSKELKEKKKFKSPEEFEDRIKGQLSELCNKDNWTSKDLLSLKEYLYPINNHITFLMGKKFLTLLNTSTEDANFNYTEMNHNGYDIVTKINGSLIVAEIKGNIPCGKNDQYGANQKKSIKKDIDNLCELKSKGKNQVNELGKFGDAYKCLVLLENNSDAIEDLIDDNFVILKDNNITFENLHKDKINIVLINL